MLGAAAYDLYRSSALLTTETLTIIAVGFVVSFVVAMVVIRWMLGFVTRHGFAPFAWYRIAVGLLMLCWVF